MPDFNGGTVLFKSRDEFFYAEKCGDKPNTLRIVTVREAERIFGGCSYVQIHRASRTTRELFTRTISTVFDLTALFPPPNPVTERTILICWEGSHE